MRIAQFRGDKSAAVSYTFDDGYQEQFDIGLPILATHGIPATFSVIVGATRDRKSDPTTPASAGKVTWEELRDAVTRGFEVGNHSMTHADLTGITDPQRLRWEIIASADTIAKKLGQSPLVFTFPYGKWSPQLEAMALTRHAAVRRGNVVSFGSGGTASTLSQANAQIELAILLRRWLVPVIHGLATHYQPLDPKILYHHLQYVKSRQSELWIDTYSLIARYVKERQTTVYSVIGTGPRNVDFTLSCALDPAVYNVPLTFIVETGATNISDASALDVETATPLSVRVDGGRILVDVAPTRERSVTVRWGRSTP